MRSLPCRVIATSRRDLPDFSQLKLGFLSHQHCFDIFLEYYHNAAEEKPAVEKIIELSGRHTLSIELLARTARRAGLSAVGLLEKLQQSGFDLNEVVPEEVRTSWGHIDQECFFNILNKVFDIAAIKKKQEKYILTNFAVLPSLPISRVKARKWLDLADLNAVNQLLDAGWLLEAQETADRQAGIYMHQVIREVIKSRLQPNAESCQSLLQALRQELAFEGNENTIHLAPLVPFVSELVSHQALVGEDLVTFLEFVERGIIVGFPGFPG